MLTLAATLFLVNCASNSNYYSAKPLGKGNLQGYGAVSYLQTSDAEDPEVTEIIRHDFTMFEVAAAVGITDKFDIGLKYTFPLAGALEARYNLVSTGEKSGFYFTPGLHAGYTSLPSDTGEDEYRIELAVPLYASFYPTEWLGFTLIPTYSARFFTYEGAENFMEHLLGGNVNLRIGKKVGFVAEGAYHRNFTWGWSEVQVGGGLFLQLKDLF